MNECIECKEPVTERQEGVLCEECERWQHRVCGTRITREQYRQGMEDGYLDWSCNECILERNPVEPQEDVYAAELGDFVEPEDFIEDDLENPYPQPRRKLFDSLGYEYTLKVDKRRPAITWRCAMKAARCKATVMERDGYIRGTQNHVCDNIPGREKVAVIRRNVKQQALDRPFDSAAEMVEQVLCEEIGVGNVVLHPSFVIMSGKSIPDYTAVMEVILDLIPRT
ncbi:uncharacterized protein LOC117115664 [Anneissia japonica]|uniref:uncharacterized protein LOC117115664 n=1 Tax=Anneissia japonica TaxID=1529436 RepID=UPI0014257355|nr:uncharacterized protein LOC117115664 [Anneissia japonica]